MPRRLRVDIKEVENGFIIRSGDLTDGSRSSSSIEIGAGTWVARDFNDLCTLIRGMTDLGLTAKVDPLVGPPGVSFNQESGR